MVNTRNNNLITNTPTTDPIQAALAAIQETLTSIQAKVRTHTTDIANLKRGEGTSQTRIVELTGQQRTHPEPNTPYGKLIRIEFPKFSALVWYQYSRTSTGTVQTYQEAFEALLNRVDLPELVAMSMFMGGLMPEVGTPMRIWEMGWAIQCLANSWRIVKVKKLIMKFNHKGRQLVLRGMNNTHVHWMQGNEGFEAPSLARLSMALCVYPVQLCQMESAGSVSA
ncbi:hypothetical protein Tco_1068678 [Tanacetum coccineum]|uniref:Uncharacterized protein n=1 Tax=Tanacetum coccineum TaxID=301880 RepID=A0ABQ5HGK1_9ASTR